MERWRQEWAGHDGPLPAETVLAARTPLDWLGPTAVNVGDRHVRLTLHTADDVAAWSTEQAAPAEPSPTPRPLARSSRSPRRRRSGRGGGVIDRIGQAYPFAALAPSRRRGRHDAGQAADAGAAGASGVLDKPRFLAGDLPVEAADRGTATHAVLEHLDFAAADSADAVRAAVARWRRPPAHAGHGGRRGRRRHPVAAVDRRRAACSATGRPTSGGRCRSTSPTRSGEPAVDRMDHVMARGRVDLLVPDGDGWLIVDYKTDRVSGTALTERVRHTRDRLALYRTAIGTHHRAGR